MFSREYECLSGEQKREGGRKGKRSKKGQGNAIGKLEWHCTIVESERTMVI